MSKLALNKRFTMVVDVLVIAMTALTAITWLRSNLALHPVAVPFGVLLTGLLIRWYFVEKNLVRWILYGIIYVLVASAGIALASEDGWVYGVSLTPRMQLAWVVVFFFAMIARPILLSTRGSAARADTAIERAEHTRKVQEEQIRESRQREREYSNQIARERNAVTEATNPGTLTGLEPEVLEAVTYTRPANMHGEPGTGLSVSGFRRSSIDSGTAGELNFARALAQAGMLERFATFWSVHMPDQRIGASRKYQTDIDCVIITGSSVWLVDVKNYRQGDVTWVSEHRKAIDDEGEPTESFVLMAIDNATNGYVGKPYIMTQNNMMGYDVITRRLNNAGIPLTVRPVVAMMPQSNGIGVIGDATWRGNIPIVFLPQMLSWLSAEPPFDPTDEDSSLTAGIFSALIKDSSGSAARAGQYTPSRRCPECTAVMDEDAEFCFECGA